MAPNTREQNLPTPAHASNTNTTNETSHRADKPAGIGVLPGAGARCSGPGATAAPTAWCCLWSGSTSFACIVAPKVPSSAGVTHSGLGALGAPMVGWLGVVACHLSCLRRCRVLGQVVARWHLFIATWAPMLAMYWRVVLSPCMHVEACRWCVAKIRRSSARALGTMCCALIMSSQGRMRSPTIAIEKGQPWGMEHLCWCGFPMWLPTWL